MGVFSSQIRTKDLVPLCRQISTSYGAGIPILKVLDYAGEHSRNGAVRKVMRSMSDDVRRGSTLGDAARAQSKYLPLFFIGLLATGERGGQLDVMLKDLADYYEDRLSMQRMIVQMMTYPIIQMAFAWFFGTFAFGMLGVIQEALDSPTGGEGVGAVTAYFQRYLVFQAQAMAALAVLLVIAIILARMGLLSWITCFFTTHIWPVSIVTIKFGLARFFRSLSLLLGAGVSVMTAIKSSAEITSNPYMEKDLLKAIPPIRDGSTLVEAFAHTKCLTPLAREMLLVGEQSGNLEGSLKKVSEYHLQEATQAVTMATKFFTVVLLLGMAGLVGYLIITFWTKFYGSMLDGLGV